MVVEAAKAANIPVTVCGEMAGEPMIASVLVGLGIRELSMSAVSIPEVKDAVRQMAVEDTERLVARVKTVVDRRRRSARSSAPTCSGSRHRPPKKAGA